MKGRRIADLSHAEKDREGLFATRLREEEYRARRRARWSWYGQRYADLMKLIRHRVGGEGKLPDGVEDMATIIRCVAYHFQARPDIEDLDERLTSWCLDHCENWTTGWPDKGDLIFYIRRDIEGRRRDLTARDVAKALHVTWDERAALGLRTIACWDLTPGEYAKRRTEAKADADQQRNEAKRRKAGVPTWAERTWQARETPWIAMGISRSTYYARKRDGWTVASHLGEASKGSDATVQRSDSVATSPATPSSKSSRCVRPSLHRRSELGTDSTSGRKEAVAHHDARGPLGIANQQSRNGGANA